MLLSKPWDGQFEQFPSFVVNLLISANQVNWNNAAPHGILSAPTGGNTNFDIITKFQSISSANIAEAFEACTNNHIIQNPKAFYSMLSESVTGKFRNTAFEQAQNLPTNKDGVTIFNIFTSFTVVASLQILILSFNQITSLIPSTYN